MKLFDKIPTNFFSLLTRKYRSIYAFALLTLYDALKTYKTKIKRSDYVSMLKNRGSELLNLFDINEDRSEDGDETKDETTKRTLYYHSMEGGLANNVFSILGCEI